MKGIGILRGTPNNQCTTSTIFCNLLKLRNSRQIKVLKGKKKGSNKLTHHSLTVISQATNNVDMDFSCQVGNWAMKKKPGCFGYRGDYTTQLYGEYKQPL